MLQVNHYVIILILTPSIHDQTIGACVADEPVGCCAQFLTILSIFLIIITFPLSLLYTIKVCMVVTCYTYSMLIVTHVQVVQEYQRAVIFRLGRIVRGGARGPGIFFIIPCIDEYRKVDLRTVTFDVPAQEILTKDSVTIAVDAVVYYRIRNATSAITNIENYKTSTQLVAQTTLRNVLGTKNLSEILSEREGISHATQSILDETTGNKDKKDPKIP